MAWWTDVPFTTPAVATPNAVVQSQHRNILRNNDNYLNGLLQAPSAANQVPALIGSETGAWSKLATVSFQAGAAVTDKLADGAVTTVHLKDAGISAADLDSAAAAALMPAGLVLLVRTAAEIPSGWDREDDLDGRLLINAGTTFSVTFGEASDYGSSWSHDHTFSITTGTPSATQGPTIATITPQQTDAASASHTHALSGTTGSSAWAIPVRAYVYMRKAA